MCRPSPRVLRLAASQNVSGRRETSAEVRAAWVQAGSRYHLLRHFLYTHTHSMSSNVPDKAHLHHQTPDDDLFMLWSALHIKSCWRPKACWHSQLLVRPQQDLKLSHLRPSRLPCIECPRLRRPKCTASDGRHPFQACLAAKATLALSPSDSTYNIS